MKYNLPFARRLAFAIVLLPLAARAADTTPHWQILPEKSSIEWTATYGGKPIKGGFPDFEANIAFDPAHLDTSHATIKVAMAKLKSSDKDAQENLPTPDWFLVSDFPLAVFEATSFKHVNGEEYEAVGTLSIRGKVVPITLPFTAKFFDDSDTSPSTHYARINGETTLKRLDYGVGQGDWAKTDAVANEVKVAIHIEARQVK